MASPLMKWSKVRYQDPEKTVIHEMKKTNLKNLTLITADFL